MSGLMASAHPCESPMGFKNLHIFLRTMKERPYFLSQFWSQLRSTVSAPGGMNVELTNLMNTIGHGTRMGALRTTCKASPEENFLVAQVVMN